VRICVCGDSTVGKSSLIASLVKDTFISGKLQSVLLPITLPPGPSVIPQSASLSSSATTPNYTTVIVDTSALPQNRDSLQRELRKANVILLLYADNYSYERVALFWIPHFRTLGLNVPVVLCASKADLRPAEGSQLADEMLAVMGEFKEIDSCIRTSAKEHKNITEVFFLCQKAVAHPIAPLWDSKEAALKPAASAALKRIFYLCDKDQDGFWSDEEVQDFQTKCFDKPLGEAGLTSIKKLIQRVDPNAVTDKGINEHGFEILNKSFAEKGRHETIWVILRKFYYTDSLSLQESFLHPKVDVPPHASMELSPTGYRFFVDLFLLHDKDNDGGLNDTELAALFAPTPGIPHSWIESAFPNCTVRNEAGHITLQGWLAQWNMTTFEEPRTTLEYLAYLGFENKAGTTAAIRITKPRKNRRRPYRVERNVFLCYVLGGSGAGKTSLLNALLQRPFSSMHIPTIQPRSAVNSVELPGGKQCYLILKELGEVEGAILENAARLDACDLVCYTYDSADPDSFVHIAELREKYPLLENVPGVIVALKADQDKTMQRFKTQPDEYAAALRVAAPLHVSVRWNSISELFTHVSSLLLVV
jgi:mitochondrial Rho GTPase 1